MIKEQKAAVARECLSGYLLNRREWLEKKLYRTEESSSIRCKDPEVGAEMQGRRAGEAARAV